MPLASLASAATVIVPWTVEPAAGCVTVTVGGVESGGSTPAGCHDARNASAGVIGADGEVPSVFATTIPVPTVVYASFFPSGDGAGISESPAAIVVRLVPS